MNGTNKVVKNFSWKFFERISAQFVTFFVSIVLARLLSPSDYGIIAIVTIFITIANVLVSDGFGSALIQKKDADELDFSTVLIFNIIFSVILYISIFFAAPLIARFYGEGYEILIPVLRVIGLRVIMAAINSVQQAYVSRKMIFKKFFLATLIGTIVSAIVGIWMAYNGYGVWSLVAQYLVNTFVDTIVLQLSLRRMPKIMFSFVRLRQLFKYGIKILGVGLLITGYQELRALLIGKLYSSEDLAFFTKGKQFPNLLIININASIGAVLFPQMSENQSDKQMIKEMTRKSIRFSSYVLSPMMLGLAAIAPIFIPLLLTDKWIPCIHLMQLFCIIYLFHPIHTANMQAIKAIGKSDTYLKLEIIKKIIELAVLLFVMWISVDAIVISMACLTFLFIFVNAYPNTKMLNYSLKEQLRDILPPICMAAIMGIIVYLFNFLSINTYLLLTIQVFTGVFLYIILSLIFKNNEFYIIMRMLKKKQ